jgi:hypothetical protein
MENPSLNTIKKAVREVLAEMGLTEKPIPPKVQDKGPRTLFVFHGGVRKLDLALEQVRLMEASSGKSGVYTVASARKWVCGGDVRERVGSHCILDTVKPDALERVLARSDVLVLPTFCLKTAAKLAHLTCDDEDSGIVLSGLLQGKRILASRDGFLLCDLLANDKIREEIELILTKLEGFGMVFCPTDRLNAAFQTMIDQKKQQIVPEAETKLAALPLALVTSREVYAAVQAKQRSICVAPKGKVTPLARDLAKEYAIEILESCESKAASQLRIES